MRPLVLVIASIVLAAIGQLTMKSAMSEAQLSILSPLHAATSILSRPLVYVGLVFYGASAFLWLISLSRLNLSYMYPFTALLVVLIVIASKVVFHDPINTWKAVGIGFVCIGLIIMANSNS